MKMYACALVSVVGLAVAIAGGSLANPPAGGHETKSTPPASSANATTSPGTASSGGAAAKTAKAAPKSKSGKTGATSGAAGATPAGNTAGDDHGSSTPKDAHAENQAHDAHDQPATGKHDNAHEGEDAKTPGASATPAHDDGHAPSADEALELLKKGNENWVKNNLSDPNTEPARREDTAAQGQKPFATILTCADSRLPVERMFDRGVGELFVLRVAGNVVNSDNAATIEYGTHHLHSGLLVVMGHTKCGAVAAAASGAKLDGNLGKLVDKIEPAVERAEKDNPGKSSDELLPLAIHENVWQSIFDLLRTSPETCKAVKNGELKIVGAVCDIKTGEVEWLGEHPWQAEMVDAFLKRADETEHASADSDH